MVTKEEMKKAIVEGMANTKAWCRVPTSEPGIFLIKAPEKGGKYPIMIEVNPVDETGKPIKRRGVFITSLKQLDCFKEAMKSDKVSDLVKTIEEINGTNTKELAEKNRIEL